MILVVAAVTGVLAVSEVPGAISARIESAICRVSLEPDCAAPSGSGRVAAEGRPAGGQGSSGGQGATGGQGSTGGQAGPTGSQALADTAAGRGRSGRPTPPEADTAREELDKLTVADEGDDDGYDRDEFPHWADQGDSCDTREAVLKRDGDGVKTASDCYPTAGSWYSPYDGETWDDPADVDIDHLVPLAEAWRSGADEWSKEQREAFANDLEHAQLWAVTDNVNQAKGDKDPAEWMPENTEIHCEYARAWVDVKYQWKLTIDEEEKEVLTEVLEDC
jgi:Protein of unknown function (DUF1524)